MTNPCRGSVVHVIGKFSPEHGGPVVSLRNYAMGQAGAGWSVSVYTLDGYPGCSPAIRLATPVTQFVGKVGWPSRLGRSAELRADLRLAGVANVYHFHGLWLRAMFYGYEVARAAGKPYLIEVNGALDPLELATKAWRKRLAGWWFQNRMLREASCIHVNSVREARHVRALGFTAPIAVISAGFNVAESDALLEQAQSAEPPWARPLQGRRVLLYLARIHEAKGIDDLLAAWVELSGDHPDWDLLIVGPGEPSEVGTRKAQVAAAGLNERCVWAGMVSDVERAWAYSRAELYVLPSHKENFGNTVQEALGYGTPVLTTTQTPWKDLEERRCGWTCDDNVRALKNSLGRLLGLSAPELKEAGARGRAMILNEFSLERMVDQQLAVYSWLRGGPQPACIS